MNGFNNFMHKRYGADLLSWCLIMLAVVMLLIVSLFDVWWLCLLPIIPAAFSVYRTFSQNITARRNENAWLLGLAGNIRLSKSKFRDRKTHIYFKCNRCHAVLRIPRGKGIVKVTCPRCKAVSEKDTGSQN